MEAAAEKREIKISRNYTFSKNRKVNFRYVAGLKASLTNNLSQDSSETPSRSSSNENSDKENVQRASKIRSIDSNSDAIEDSMIAINALVEKLNQSIKLPNGSSTSTLEAYQSAVEKEFGSEDCKSKEIVLTFESIKEKIINAAVEKALRNYEANRIEKERLMASEKRASVVEKLEEKRNTLASALSDKSSALADLQKLYEEKEKAHEEEMQNLKDSLGHKSYELEVQFNESKREYKKLLTQEHKENVGQLQEQHKENVTQLQEQHEDAIEQLRKVLTATNEKLKEEYACEINEKTAINSALAAEIQYLKETLKEVEKENVEKTKALAEMKADTTETQRKMNQTIAALEKSNEERQKELITERQDRHAELAKERQERQAELAKERDERRAELAKEREERGAEVEELKRDGEERLRQQDEAIRAELKEFVELARTAETTALAKCNEHRKNYANERQQRIKVHNDLLRVCGNIRVFCRVRPPNDRELAVEDFTTAAEVTSETEVKIEQKNCRSTKFEFDHVFGPEESQEKIFEHVQPLCISFLDGFNICIFAYGQTGSGKTYTMEGKGSGVSPRVMDELFTLTEERQDLFNYTLVFSMIQIHNDNIYDLLGDHREDKLNVRQTVEGKFEVIDATETVITSAEEAQRLIDQGQRNRAVSSHNLNRESSRSHTIITVKMTGRCLVDGKDIPVAKLQLIDLAGSERITRSGAVGDALIESNFINKSLLALGDCVNALAERREHVPYRNSKLTFFLKDSLGGKDVKVFTFVNIAPSGDDAAETLCSLKFADRCRQTDLTKLPSSFTVGQSRTPSSNSRNATPERGQLSRQSSLTPPKPPSSISSPTASSSAKSPSSGGKSPKSPARKERRDSGSKPRFNAF